VQATEAGGYPPIINAASVMAAAGWQVLILNAPITGHNVVFPQDCGVTLKTMPARPSHIVRKRDYLRYLLSAARLAASFRPNVVYASDPLGALPGLVASRISRARLVYHEHDSPNPGALDPKVMRFRAIAAKAACVVIFPNEARARLAQEQTGFRDEQLRIVWNLPRLSELPRLDQARNADFALYYHGTVTPKLLPERIVEALANRCTRITLRVVGYEAPDARGYAERLVNLGKRKDGNLVEYLGSCSRDRLITLAAQASVGLALFPKDSSDVNLRFLTGASNKVFDYMAAGLALLLPETRDWHREFIAPGYGLSCDPENVESMALQIEWLAKNPEQRRSMGQKARRKIEQSWNYETAFAPILDQMARTGGKVRVNA
jgi:glycosyltransferase involved in cell wall biosynthesis